MLGKGEAPSPREPEEEEEDTRGVVKLISAEGFVFVIDKKAAMVSNTLRNMLTSPGTFRCFSSPIRFDLVRFLPPNTFMVTRHPPLIPPPPSPWCHDPGGFSETRHGEVRFPEISTHVLEKICQYFYWSLRYSRLHPDSLACACARLFACAHLYKSKPIVIFYALRVVHKDIKALLMITPYN
jgi:transcription elongation factor B subunit 1